MGTYDGGWKALIDGVSAPIYRADYAFRAVYLEPGDHQIVFVYHPSSSVLGRWLLGVGLLGVVVAAMHAAWQLRSPSRGLGTASRSRDH